MKANKGSEHESKPDYMLIFLFIQYVKANKAKEGICMPIC